MIYFISGSFSSRQRSFFTIASSWVVKMSAFKSSLFSLLKTYVNILKLNARMVENLYFQCNIVGLCLKDLITCRFRRIRQESRNLALEKPTSCSS